MIVLFESKQQYFRYNFSSNFARIIIWITLPVKACFWNRINRISIFIVKVQKLMKKQQNVIIISIPEGLSCTRGIDIIMAMWFDASWNDDSMLRVSFS